MTPFGAKVRALRRAQGVTLKKMATDLQISQAYLSALEHGRRGRPAQNLVRQICVYFNIIWDDAEALENLARLSHPRVVVDTAGLSPKATELANRLAESIGDVDEPYLEKMLRALSDANTSALKE
jgi:transcriptional regulator with XRE-family HTH domain